MAFGWSDPGEATATSEAGAFTEFTTDTPRDNVKASRSKAPTKQARLILLSALSKFSHSPRFILGFCVFCYRHPKQKRDANFIERLRPCNRVNAQWAIMALAARQTTRACNSLDMKVLIYTLVIISPPQLFSGKYGH